MDGQELFPTNLERELDIGFPVWVAIFIFIGIFIGLKQQYDKTPPSPSGYPLIGNILSLRKENVLVVFRKLRVKHGDIYTFNFGTESALVVNGLKNMKTLFQEQADYVSDRPKSFLFGDVSKSMGLTGASGFLWRSQRKFATETLHSICIGQLEKKIQTEIEVFLQFIEQQHRKPININSITQRCAANILWSLIDGERFEHNDLRFKKILGFLNKNSELLGIAGVLDVYPYIKTVVGDFSRRRNIKKNVDFIRALCHEIVEDHKKNFDDKRPVTNYIDAFIKEGKNHGESATNTFTDDQLTMSIWDMLSSGTDTTAAAIRWAVLYLVKYQSYQKELREEVDAVIGSRPPSLSDISKMPFCNAFMTEVFRCGNICPLSVQHYCKRDIIFKGYHITKDTILILNLDSVHFDPRIFKNPREFQPLRFIDWDGSPVDSEKVIPFSVGKRTCIGGNLARSQLFLFITSLVQRFCLVPDHLQRMPSTKPNFGCVNMPPDFQFYAFKANQTLSMQS